ncbi:MAG: hypothetical protein RL264_1338 [Bacteroidota bacterium]|jgi:ZIP family zinc transporter
MQTIIDFFEGIPAILGAFVATSFTWFITALGAALVFFFKEIRRAVLDGMLGFTGGIMVAASVWSLLIPSIDQAERSFPSMPWMPAAVGFITGALFIYILDKKLPHLHINFQENETEGVSTNLHQSTLLMLAITLHNIPEGLAIGVAFGAAAQGIDGFTIASAVTLAIGIGIQNFPEGFAIAMPLRRAGATKWKSFWYGQLSAVVEPIAGIIGALAVTQMAAILPFALSFAAGAMMFVVVEEVIPETQRDKYTDLAVLGFIAGFTVMMVLDVGLG